MSWTTSLYSQAGGSGEVFLRVAVVTIIDGIVTVTDK